MKIKIFYRKNFPLRKHAYSNILNISPPKTENFQIKFLIFFIFLLKNIDFGYTLEPPRRGGSNEYPQSMFLSRNIKKILLIDRGCSLEPPRRDGSNKYPQSMFLSRNKKNNVYLCKPQFYYIKVGFEGVEII